MGIIAGDAARSSPLPDAGGGVIGVQPVTSAANVARAAILLSVYVSAATPRAATSLAVTDKTRVTRQDSRVWAPHARSHPPIALYTPLSHSP